MGARQASALRRYTASQKVRQLRCHACGKHENPGYGRRSCELPSVRQVKLPVRVLIRLAAVCEGFVQISRRRVLQCSVFARVSSRQIPCSTCGVRHQAKGRGGNHCCQELGTDDVSRCFHGSLPCCHCGSVSKGGLRYTREMERLFRRRLLILALLGERLPKARAERAITAFGRVRTPQRARYCAHHVFSPCLHHAAARFSAVSTPLASARIIQLKPHQSATQPPWM